MSADSTSFPDPTAWFAKLTGHPGPRPWQKDLLLEGAFGSRLIRIPTGFGKTDGVLAAWLYRCVVTQDKRWPRRLVLCLPMRVLVEQTVANVRERLTNVGLLSEPGGSGVAVHLLMGGVDQSDWHLYPEQPAVLVGTMDMLLSRALNRGYAAARARWPIEFGLMHQDCLWVFDEVQLMDVGLATSAQIEAFRDGDAPRGFRPIGTWWMSATLQRPWLESPDTRALVQGLLQTAIKAHDRSGHLWDDVTKPCTLVPLDDAKATSKKVADLVAEHGAGKLTLVVVNTVDRATEIFDGIARQTRGADVRLVHSRFRPYERRVWREQFLNRKPVPASGRIIVATQVVEAGVDLDAQVLVTELAPWPSLVQRFGRLARDGGTGQAFVVDPGFQDDRGAAPYTVAELDGARSVLPKLPDVAPIHIERFEEAVNAEELARIYPYEAAQLLLRHELEELFDTTPDLTGGDLDISRFIRSGEERDCTVFWIDVPSDLRAPDPSTQPARDALCPVPFLKAQDWLCDGKGQKLKESKRAWVWDFVEGEWRACRRVDIQPGKTILVDAKCGGYSGERGFDPRSDKLVSVVVPEVPPSAQALADVAEDGEQLSETSYWKTIATHGAEVAAEARRIAGPLVPPAVTALLDLAGLWHDLGKAHPVFQASIENGPSADLAKAPKARWLRPSQMYRDPKTKQRRPGFRHELASMLGLFAVVRAHAPQHAALLGPWRGLFDVVESTATLPPTPVEQRVLALDAASFDLVAYLVATHHGKVRLSLGGSPSDQRYRGNERPIRGVLDGDVLPGVVLDPQGPPLPQLTLRLTLASIGLSDETGASWSERVGGLIQRHGIWALAFLEACMRAADVRASRLTTGDPRLVEREVKA